MSIKRYNISGLHPHIIEDKNGFMIYYEDYASLKTEARNLNEVVADLRISAEDDLHDIEAARIENARLKAEVERLSKPAIIGGYNLSQYIRMANSETLEFDSGDIFADMTLPERIKYIVESHARLKAEVERLEAFCTRTIVPNEELQAQVERLTKAGDYLADAFYQMSKSRPNFYSNAYAYWFDAKEGEQP
jgi:hypothetical protein